MFAEVNTHTRYGLGSRDTTIQPVEWCIVFNQDNPSACVALDYLFYALKPHGVFDIFPSHQFADIKKISRRARLFVIDLDIRPYQSLIEEFNEAMIFTSFTVNLKPSKHPVFMYEHYEEVFSTLARRFPCESKLAKLYHTDRKAFYKFYNDQDRNPGNVFDVYDTICNHPLINFTAKL